ncbi:hypothetical protein BU25DRAFT_414582, partial [Macroventuria anomochaeta]
MLFSDKNADRIPGFIGSSPKILIETSVLSGQLYPIRLSITKIAPFDSNNFTTKAPHNKARACLNSWSLGLQYQPKKSTTFFLTLTPICLF